MQSGMSETWPASSARAGAAALANLALVMACGAGEERPPRPGALPPMQTEIAAGSSDARRQLLGPFLARHWRLPVPPQGPPPPDWSVLEASLAPEDCGACHPKQLAEWRGSLHAAAFSPGLAGQLVEGALAAPAELRACQGCHAPLAEQQPYDAQLQPNPSYDPELRADGIVCAACHVRRHRRLGPPRRAGAPAPARTAPHAGFEARPEFQQSRFCAECHQFFDGPTVNGKPLQNTYLEWRESPQAAAGLECQSCHMPDRAHLWRGIHDPETVRSAVEAELVLVSGAEQRIRASLRLHNRGVGHAFPTYVTPRVFLALWQEDAAGQSIAGTRRESEIGRIIDFAASPWREISDTRIAAGASHAFAYGEPRAPQAVALAARIRVDPDFHYRSVFAEIHGGLGAEAAALIGEARRALADSAYLLQELRVTLPGPEAGARESARRISDGAARRPTPRVSRGAPPLRRAASGP